MNLKLIALVLIAPLLVSCNALCGTDNFSSAVFSPNKKLKALVHTYDCGATTAYSTHVSVLPSNAPNPSNMGNVLRTGDDTAASVEWLDDSTLQVLNKSTYSKFKVSAKSGGLFIEAAGSKPY